jgi:tetratricopeptide (TPR) repeat protein
VRPRTKWIVIGSLVGFFLLVGVAIGTGVYFVVSAKAARDLFEQGYAAMNHQEYDVAISRFDAALRKNLPRSFKAYAYENRAYCHQRKKQPAEAMRDYSEALRIDPTLTFAYGQRAALHEEKDEQDEAIDDYTELIRRDPNSFHALYHRGLLFMGKGNLTDAIADFSEAIRSSPRSAIAYLERGVAYTRRKDLDAAQASFDSAIRVNPRFARVYLYRGNLFRQKHDLDKAMADYNEAIRLHPKYGEAFRARATLFSDQSKWNEAIADYSEAIKRNAKDREALQGRGWAYLQKSDYLSAAADFTELIKLKASRRAYDYRARAYTKAGQYARAVADYKQGAQESGPVTTAVKGLAWLLATCPDAAFRNAKEAIAEAKEDCERTAWRNSNCLDTLAAACAEGQDFEEAVKFEKQALNITDLPPEGSAEMRQRLALYEKHQPYREELKR